MTTQHCDRLDPGSIYAGTVARCYRTTPKSSSVSTAALSERSEDPQRQKGAAPSLIHCSENLRGLALAPLTSLHLDPQFQMESALTAWPVVATSLGGRNHASYAHGWGPVNVQCWPGSLDLRRGRGGFEARFNCLHLQTHGAGADKAHRLLCCRAPVQWRSGLCRL